MPAPRTLSSWRHRAITVAALIISATSSVGCASAPTHEDPVPSVTIPNVAKTRIVSDLIGHAAQNGWHVAASTDYSVRLEKDATGLAASLLYGSSFNGTPRLREEFTIVETDAGVVVTAQAWIVTNPGSGYENPKRLDSGRQREELTRALSDLKARVSAASAIQPHS